MNIEHEVAVLEQTSTIDLRKRFAAVCGYATKNRNLAVRHDIWDFPREFSPPMIREPSIGHVLRFGITW